MPDNVSASYQDTSMPNTEPAITAGAAQPAPRAWRGLASRLVAMWAAVRQRGAPRGNSAALLHISESELRDIGASPELRAHIHAKREFERCQSGSPYYFW
jgi:hypothetical protein